jgi:hypothetical protein
MMHGFMNVKNIYIIFILHVGIRMGRDRTLNIIVLKYEMEIALCTIKSFNPFKTRGRLLYLKNQSYRAVNTFHLGYKNQSDVSGTRRSLFSDKYKTRKLLCGQSLQLLNVKLMVHHVSSRL